MQSVAAWILILLLSGVMQGAEIAGLVMDASTREPVAKAMVRDLNTSAQTVTGKDGRFVLNAGETANLQVSCTGYRAFKTQVDAGAVSVEILLVPDTLRQSENITVSAGSFDVEPQNAMSLAGSELRNLASVLADDPLRAIQGLPGVNPNDDFQSQIALRGAAPNRTGIYLDGVLLHSPFHTLQADTTSASLTVLSSDLLERAELFPSSAPAQYADRTVGVVDMRLRDGDRKKFTGRAAASASNASVSLESPFAKGRGSWILSARKSYLQYIINSTSDEPSLAFGFWDVQGKASYDLTSKHALSFTAIHGRSGLDRSGAENLVGINTFFTTGYSTTLLKLGSRWTPNGKWLFQQNGAWLRERYENRNKDANPLAAGHYAEWIGNSDNSWQWSEHATLGFGGTLRRMGEDGYLDRRLATAPFVQRQDRYTGTGLRTGVHLVEQWQTWKGRFHLRGGGRWDRHSVNQVQAFSPVASAALYLTPATQLTANYGQYVQYPELNQMFSRFGRPRLLAERANHLQLSVEQRLGERTRIRVEAYDRADRDLLARPLFDPRILNGRIYAGNNAARYENSLRGYARGLQFLIQRRSSNGLTGWASYSYNTSRVRDGVLGLAYPADYDQKHVANFFLSYRLRPTVNLSGRFTYASGYPVRGFYTGTNPFFLTAARNQIRIPEYHRADLRANKTFVRKGWHITLFIEVINLYNHDNVRFDDVRSIDTRTGVARLGFDQMFPIVPSAGVAVDW